MYINKWLYQNKEFEESDIGEYEGFVYLITDLSSDKKYIGKKIFYTKVVKPPLKGKKRRRISRKFSDWESYYGSSDEVKGLVAEHGVERFKREIIQLCRSKSEMSYFETKEIFVRDVLIRPDYYNSWVSCRIQRNTLKALADENNLSGTV